MTILSKKTMSEQAKTGQTTPINFKTLKGYSFYGKIWLF